MSARFPHTLKATLRTHADSLLIASAVVLVVASLIYADERARFAYERAVFYAFPTAERAFKYGENHFSSLNTRMYDLESAEYFFNRAYVLDPELPYLNHEMARVAFLRGQYDLAIERIDREFEVNPEPSPSSYYIKGLIEGYMGRYADAAKNYEKFIERRQGVNWAAQNDYAWVLLKDGRPAEAHAAIVKALEDFPQNPWLLNTDAIALFEMGKREEALAQIRAAAVHVQKVTEEEWLIAYPGNDPRLAPKGIETLKVSTAKNMHIIESATSTAGVQFTQ